MSSGIKRILLGLSGSHYDGAICKYAFLLAARDAAVLDIRLVRPMADDPAVLMASGFTGTAFKHFIESVDHTVAELDLTARKAIDAASSGHPNVVYEYHSPEYYDLDVLASQGIGADLIVLTHPALMNFHYYREAVEHAIANSGRPVLLMTEESRYDTLDENVVFVLRNDVITAVAMVMSLPLLATARQVTLLSVLEPEQQTANLADKASVYFSDHGVNVNLVSLPRGAQRAERVIDEYCSSIDASLLVSGVVVHSDNREFFFSSTASRMLSEGKRPVLLIG